MTITFSQTARDVVKGAMQDMGILRLGADPKAQELAYGIEQLNLLLKDLAAEGIVPWTGEDGEVLFTAGTDEMTLSPRPTAVHDARVQLASGYFRPLHMLEPGEYDLYPNPAQTGTPITFEVRETPGTVTMRLWPVPSADTTIAYSYSRVIEDVDAGTALDVPQMWGAAVREMLKARLTAFGPVDPATEARAEYMKRRLIDFSRPASYTIGYDCW